MSIDDFILIFYNRCFLSFLVHEAAGHLETAHSFLADWQILAKRDDVGITITAKQLQVLGTVKAPVNDEKHIFHFHQGKKIFYTDFIQAAALINSGKQRNAGIDIIGHKQIDLRFAKLAKFVPFFRKVILRGTVSNDMSIHRDLSGGIRD